MLWAPIVARHEGEHYKGDQRDDKQQEDDMVNTNKAVKKMINNKKKKMMNRKERQTYLLFGGFRLFKGMPCNVGMTSVSVPTSGASTMVWEPPMSTNATCTKGVDVGVEEESPKLDALDLVATKSRIAAIGCSPLLPHVLWATSLFESGTFRVEEVAGSILGW